MKPATIEQSHGKLRLQGVRSRDLKRPPKSAPPTPKRKRVRAHRPANQSLFAALRVEAGRTDVGDAPVLARRALSLFRAAAKEHASASITARAHMLAWALQTAVGQLLTLEAGRVGLSSAQGLELVERAGRVQGRAARSWTAAAAAAGLLGGREPIESAAELAELLRDAAKPREGT